jgi:hypothetical protein
LQQQNEREGPNEGRKNSIIFILFSWSDSKLLFAENASLISFAEKSYFLFTAEIAVHFVSIMVMLKATKKGKAEFKTWQDKRRKQEKKRNTTRRGKPSQAKPRHGKTRQGMPRHDTTNLSFRRLKKMAWKRSPPFTYMLLVQAVMAFPSSRQARGLAREV